MGIATLVPANVKFIAIHCSATPPSRDIGAKEIDRMHRERGFIKIGYHFVIRRNGAVEKGRDITEVGAHVEGYNSQSIGICLVGGVSADDVNKAENDYSDDQFHALATLLIQLHPQFPHAVVQGHRDFPNVAKACPCFSAKEWYAETVKPLL